MDFRKKRQFTDHCDLVDQHIQNYFEGSEINVFHEIPTLDIHLDVYQIRPKNADFEVLLTSGMSSISMNVSEIPNDSEKYQFAELMVIIPPGINFGIMYPSGTKYDWIISMLKASAKFPHFYDTWLGVGHTIQADENMGPYSRDTKYCGCMVLPTMTFPKDFQKVKSPHGVINIYGLFPLYKEELEFKIRHGYNEFIQFLIKDNAKEIIDFNRANYCKTNFNPITKFKSWTKRFFG